MHSKIRNQAGVISKRHMHPGCYVYGMLRHDLNLKSEYALIKKS